MKTLFRTQQQRKLFAIWVPIGILLALFAMMNVWLATTMSTVQSEEELYLNWPATWQLKAIAVSADLTVATVLVCAVLVIVAFHIGYLIYERWVKKGA